MMIRILFPALLLAATPALAEPLVEVWKAESCGCCGGWVDHMKAQGFTVRVHPMDDVSPIKAMLGVPSGLASCHTATIDGYVVEGHVPAADIRRLLAERPKARGLSAPGMPADAPGMDLKSGQPYDVVLFGGDKAPSVFAHH